MMTSDGFAGIVTNGGREVSREEGVPSLADIALSLSRQPRFAGHTRGWWSVLDHSIIVAEFALDKAWQRDRNYRHGLTVAALLHDAHEALTGDVPTPFKSPALRVTQRRMDERIMDAYMPGGYGAYQAFSEEVKELDHRALVTEAQCVGPSAFFGKIEHYFGAVPALHERSTLERYYREIHSSDLGKGADAKNVRTFLDKYTKLR